jgi:hypothetical protein
MRNRGFSSLQPTHSVDKNYAHILRESNKELMGFPSIPISEYEASEPKLLQYQLGNNTKSSVAGLDKEKRQKL